MEWQHVVVRDSDSESCSRGVKRQSSKPDLTDLSDSDAQPAQSPAVVRPDKIQKQTKSTDPATMRARISHLVGTTCTCARQRKKANMSCHRQFRGDVDNLTNLRVDLHKLAIADMDAKAA